MLEARRLSKSYGNRPVVADLSIDVGAGEIVGLLGPNGAGKSTTVGDAVRAGRRPTRGQVLVGRRAASAGDGRARAKRRIGLVPQDLALYEDLARARQPASSSARSMASPGALLESARRRGADAGRPGRPRARPARAPSAAA